jgi:septal ring factor EnvC (AmiA/AmiB activator)
MQILSFERERVDRDQREMKLNGDVGRLTHELHATVQHLRNTQTQLYEAQKKVSPRFSNLPPPQFAHNNV